MGSKAGSALGDYLSDMCMSSSDKPGDLPTIDSTGRVHGDVPPPEDLKNHSSEDLKALRDALSDSVQERIENAVDFGRDLPHGQRQGTEQQTIRNIDKILSDRGYR